MFADGLSQSPITSSALPSSRQRAVNGPALSSAAHSSSQRDLARTATVPTPPKSAGLVDKSLRVASGPKSSASPEDDDKLKRKHSHETKVNVYTECGRHSDEWLFGGFSVADAVKRLWEKERKEPARN